MAGKWLLAAFFCVVLIASTHAGEIGSTSKKQILLALKDECDLVKTGYEPGSTVWNADRFLENLKNVIFEQKLVSFDNGTSGAVRNEFIKLNKLSIQKLSDCRVLLNGFLEFETPNFGASTSKRDESHKKMVSKYESDVLEKARKKLKQNVEQFSANGKKKTRAVSAEETNTDKKRSIILDYEMEFSVQGRRLIDVTHPPVPTTTNPQVVRGNTVGVLPISQNNTNTSTDAGIPWHLDRLSRPYPDGIFTYPPSYANLPSPVVYIVDTGALASHEAFLDKTRSFSRLSHIYDAFPTQTPISCHFHGTHVSALACGTGTSANSGNDCRIFVSRVLDCQGNGNMINVVAGLWAVHDHCVAQGFQSITVSMSLGGASTSTSEQQTVADAFNALKRDCDAEITVAAGNDAADACNYIPASLTSTSLGQVITVAASTYTDSWASFSNWGTCVIIIAPGENIYSAVNDCNTCYGYATGTSMATPIVASVVARHSQTRPSTWLQSLSYQSGIFIQTVLYGTAIRLHVLNTAQDGAITGIPYNTITPDRIVQLDSTMPLVYSDYFPLPPSNSDLSNIVYYPDPPVFYTSKANIYQGNFALLCVALVIGLMAYYN